jgi:CRP-like cAMP-binding protein
MLRPVSIFRGLQKNTLFEVARKSVEVTYPQGATVVRQGDPGDALCIVVEGKLEVRRNDQAVAQLKAGDYFGELSLIDGEPRSATVVALSDVVLLTVKASDFSVLLGVPYVVNAVMVNLAGLVREAHAASAPTNES